MNRQVTAVNAHGLAHHDVGGLEERPGLLAGGTDVERAARRELAAREHLGERIAARSLLLENLHGTVREEVVEGVVHDTLDAVVPRALEREDVLGERVDRGFVDLIGLIPDDNLDGIRLEDPFAADAANAHADGTEHAGSLVDEGVGEGNVGRDREALFAEELAGVRVAAHDVVLAAVDCDGGSNLKVGDGEGFAGRAHRGVALQDAALDDAAVVRLVFVHVHGAVLEVEPDDAPPNAVSAVERLLDEIRAVGEGLTVVRYPRGGGAALAELHVTEGGDRGGTGRGRGTVLRVNRDGPLDVIGERGLLVSQRAPLRGELLVAGHASGDGARGVGLIGKAGDEDAAAGVVEGLGELPRLRLFNRGGRITSENAEHRGKQNLSHRGQGDGRFGGRNQGLRAGTHPGERQAVPRKQGDVLVVTHGAREARCDGPSFSWREKRISGGTPV